MPRSARSCIKGRPGKIHLWHQAVQGIEILIVGIPAIHVHFDKSHAPFHQPAGQETPLTEEGVPVAIANLSGLFL